ncbi:MAG TPA: hypothetical protein VFA97_00350 [Gaiellaceae bacterium]|nr:hypothetical protein [Gaiellaceae bacterium]
MTGRAWTAVAALAGAASLAGCGGGAHAPRAEQPAAPARLAFTDPSSQPLRIVDRGVVERRGQVSVHDVSYTSGDRRVVAYLVEPADAHGARAGVVLVHGSGGDRHELLVYAIDLARHGMLAIAPTMPSERPQSPPVSLAALLAQARSSTVEDVVAVRRAGDVLVAHGARRLGYLGWSSGAKTGTFVAASDRRFAGLALLSAGAATVGQFVSAAPAGSRALVRRELSLVDPIGYVALARPGTLLLENGTRDAVVPRAALDNIVHAAPKGTVVRWYPAGHALDAAAYRAAITWLLARL